MVQISTHLMMVVHYDYFIIMGHLYLMKCDSDGDGITDYVELEQGNESIERFR